MARAKMCASSQAFLGAEGSLGIWGYSKGWGDSRVQCWLMGQGPGCPCSLAVTSVGVWGECSSTHGSVLLPTFPVVGIKNTAGGVPMAFFPSVLVKVE